MHISIGVYPHILVGSISRTWTFSSLENMSYAHTQLNAYALEHQHFTKVWPCTAIHLNGRLYMVPAAAKVQENTWNFMPSIFSVSHHPCSLNLWQVHWQVSTCLFFVYWHAFWCTRMHIANAFLNTGFGVKRGNSHWPRHAKHFVKHQSAYCMHCHWLLWASQCNKMQKKMSDFSKCTVLQCRDGNRL